MENQKLMIHKVPAVLRYMQQHFKTIGLRVNSIGAWFAIQNFSRLEFKKCLLVSPVLDMEKFHSSLTVMKNGEHWFHAPEQLDVLNQWVKECI